MLNSCDDTRSGLRIAVGEVMTWPMKGMPPNALRLAVGEVTVHYFLDVHDELVCIFRAVFDLGGEKDFEQCDHGGGSIWCFSLNDGLKAIT